MYINARLSRKALDNSIQIDFINLTSSVHANLYALRRMHFCLIINRFFVWLITFVLGMMLFDINLFKLNSGH